MQAMEKGRYRVRPAATAADLDAAQRLRHRAFAADRPDAAPGGRDADPFDDRCTHALVEEIATGRLVCCFRLLPLADGARIGESYSAQYYELSPLADFGGPIVEMGRFCVDPATRDPDILRIAWAALTRHVDATGVKLLFGCASFKGTDAAAYLDAFAMLKERHLGPKRRQSCRQVRCDRAFAYPSFARGDCDYVPDVREYRGRWPVVNRCLKLDRLGNRC